ncbi:MAG TPA: TlpA disulfide reductase family protein [Acidobacteriaceae bacterium]|nr:TlpA disulfide reductase family protein [Acidobacteriaceae bacterium]
MVVIAAVIATLGIMIWAGVSNYRRQQREQANLKRLQAMIEATQPAGAPDESDDGIDENPLQGKMAPNFTLTDTKGEKISLADYKGKAVVVDFWATWCPPCKIEIPWLEQFNEQYGGQGLQIIGISEDDLDLDNKTELAKEKQQIAETAAQLKINYPVLFDDANVSTPYGGVDGLPTTFFIDRSGKVVASTVGLAPREQIEADIKKALATGGGAS